jgi:hypothetical protein
MKNKLKLALLLTSIVSSSSAFASAVASVDNQVRAAVADIGVNIDSVTKYVENLYATNAGNDLDAAEDFLAEGVSNTNKYIKSIVIGKDYSVLITFKGATAGVKDATTTDVPAALRGVKFLLVSVYQDSPRSAYISSWECMTDADKNMVTTEVGKVVGTDKNSYISLTPDVHKYLADCKYDPDTDFASGMGPS